MKFYSDRRNMMAGSSFAYAFGLPLMFFLQRLFMDLVANWIGSAFRLGDRMSPIRSGGILPPRNRVLSIEDFVATKSPEEPRGKPSGGFAAGSVQ